MFARAPATPSARAKPRTRFALVITNVAKAKNVDTGRARHFREGKKSEKVTSGAAAKGRLGIGGPHFFLQSLRDRRTTP